MDNKNIYQILAGREKRAETQQNLIEKFKKPLVCFTLNIPGAEKVGSFFIKIHSAGIEQFEGKILQNKIKVLYKTKSSSPAGYEAFYVIDDDAKKIKMLTVSIEETHGLGRLFDFDVFDERGRQLGRKEIGLSERKCLLCEDRAVNCSRSRKHTVAEILERIYDMVDQYDKQLFEKGSKK
ncbi:MAG: citrate lyase holo-[acyl-carrier protein] synthase [Bacillota bacterium]